MQLKNMTPYNEHLTSIIVAIIVYFSAFSLLIRQALNGKIKLNKVKDWFIKVFNKIKSIFKKKEQSENKEVEK